MRSDMHPQKLDTFGGAYFYEKKGNKEQKL